MNRQVSGPPRPHAARCGRGCGGGYGCRGESPAGSGRWIRAGSRIILIPDRGPSPVERELSLREHAGTLSHESPVPARPPAGLKPLTHLHVPRLVPGGTALPTAVMKPEAMNPGFLDPQSGLPRTGPKGKGLQGRLDALLDAKYEGYKPKIAVAVVDLTGKRLYDPDLAGWRATQPIFGASLAKVAVVYAARQLQFDLATVARLKSFATGDAVVKGAREMWESEGVPASRQPFVRELLAFQEKPGQPVAVVAAPKLDELVRCIVANCNRAASLLMHRLGYAYLSSLLWQSGLFHPARSGLWLTRSFGEGCTAPGCDLAGEKLNASKPISASPVASTQNVTALSAATFFTLMAQGRLANGGTSARVRTDLQGACSFFKHFARLDDPEIVFPAKCGYVPAEGVHHDSMLVQRKVGPGSKRSIRYAVTVLTTGNVAKSTADQKKLFGELVEQVDALVQQNNP